MNQQVDIIKTMEAFAKAAMWFGVVSIRATDSRLKKAAWKACQSNFAHVEALKNMFEEIGKRGGHWEGATPYLEASMNFAQILRKITG